jgi:hypothetical protein
LKPVVFSAIRDVPKEHWNGLLAGASCTFTHEFWEVVEAAKLENFRYRYVLFYRDGAAEGQAIIVIRDFEPEAQHLRAEFERLGYYWGDSLPNTYIDIVWATPQAYLASMKSYYRSKLLRHLRRNQALGVRHELRENFDDLAQTLCRQWMVVHEQADEFQREVLTPAFFREFSVKLGAHSKVLLFFRGDELIGHALLLQDGDLLRWLYFGRNEAVNDSLYIFVAHTVIETAIRLGVRRLEMGLTTYSIKHDLGARSVPIKMALRTVIGAANWLVALIYPLVNSPPPAHNKNIFKSG